MSRAPLSDELAAVASGIAKLLELQEEDVIGFVEQPASREFGSSPAGSGAQAVHCDQEGGLADLPAQHEAPGQHEQKSQAACAGERRAVAQLLFGTLANGTRRSLDRLRSRLAVAAGERAHGPASSRHDRLDTSPSVGPW